MKLAVALSRRAELQTRLRQLEGRLCANALVQEGEEPAEDPKDLLAELEEDYTALESLIAAINRTNSAAVMESGQTLSDALAKRDCLSGKLNLLRGFLNHASARVSRHGASEIKIKSTVNVRDLQKQVDRCSKELRELDEAIQQTNWTVDLMETV